MKTWIVVPFALAAFVASVLLFSVEPMIGKMALPALGGTPAIWNTCLLYFQGILLVGYLLALLLDRIGSTASRVSLTVLVVLLILGYLVQPIELALEDPNSSSLVENPTFGLLLRLVVSSGLPLILISSTAPLIQHWFSRSAHGRADDPYFLYAASNAGSLLALVSYPLAIEPRWNLVDQATLVRCGFGGLALLLLICGWLGRAGRTNDATANKASAVNDGREAPGRRIWLRWMVLSAISSSWLLGVTTFLTTNLAAMPLLWVIPLAAFLLASIFAFAESTHGIAWRVSRLFPWLAISLVLVQLAGFVHAVWLPLHLGTFFLGCLVCNLNLAQSRPVARHSSSFYVAIAVGGLLGGAFNVLVAPVVFSGLAEYPLAILGGCLAYPRGRKNRAEPGPWSWQVAILPIVLFVCAFPLTHNLFDATENLIGPALLIAASGLGVYATLKAGDQPRRFAMTVAAVLLSGLGSTDPAGITRLRSRDFYGIVRVTEDREANCRRLLHGGTVHGEQSLEPDLSREPRTYFTKSGPVGDLFGARRGKPGGGGVAIVGLGVGTLASYAEAGETWTFYELDPTVVRIARDPHLFTYLTNSRAVSQEFVTGDARVRIREAADQGFSMIVLDAFGADAVPVHLLSREAIRLYLSKLAPGGLLIFNITNGYLDLEPVIGLQAKDAGLVCRVRRDVRVTPEERQSGKLGSIWAVLTRTEEDLLTLARAPRWHTPRTRAGARPWTDDYSDVASYLLVFGRAATETDRVRPDGPTRPSPGE